MPVKYERIKKDLLDRGYTEREAKAHAAAIYNAYRKPGQTIVSPHGENIKKRGKRK